MMYPNRSVLYFGASWNPRTIIRHLQIGRKTVERTFVHEFLNLLAMAVSQVSFVYVVPDRLKLALRVLCNIILPAMQIDTA